MVDMGRTISHIPATMTSMSLEITMAKKDENENQTNQESQGSQNQELTWNPENAENVNLEGEPVEQEESPQYEPPKEGTTHTEQYGTAPPNFTLQPPNPPVGITAQADRLPPPGFDYEPATNPQLDEQDKAKEFRNG